MWVGRGGRRQALKTEDSRRCGDRQMCGKHLWKGTSRGCVMASVGTHGEWRSGQACWGGGEVFWQGSGPWITSLLAKAGCLPSPADRQTPCLCQSAAGRRDIKHKTGRRRAELGVAALALGAACRGSWLSPVSALPCLRADRGQGWEEVGFSFGSPGQAQCQLGSTCFSGSTNATNVPLWPAGPGSADSHHGAVHVHPFVAL